MTGTYKDWLAEARKQKPPRREVKGSTAVLAANADDIPLNVEDDRVVYIFPKAGTLVLLKGPIYITWEEKANKKGVVFIPTIHQLGHNQLGHNEVEVSPVFRAEDGGDPKAAFLSMLGIDQITIKTPKEALTLPEPPWVLSNPVTLRYMFPDEAVEEVKKYIRQMAQIVGISASFD